jgi:hypothetical protein
MIERFVHFAKVDLPAAGEDAAQARVRLADRFPRGATRRMTHLGMMLGAAADGLQIQADDAVVYVTSYGETRSLEDYLRSFPTPSPLLFQSSIHPSGAQQVLIGRQQPVARLWPVAARERAVEQGLLGVLLEPASRVVLLGGEERGTWLLERGVASDRSFAFALLATNSSANALGRIAFSPGPAPAAAPPGIESFADAVAQRAPLGWDGIGGRWSVEWR